MEPTLPAAVVAPEDATMGAAAGGKRPRPPAHGDTIRVRKPKPTAPPQKPTKWKALVTNLLPPGVAAAFGTANAPKKNPAPQQTIPRLGMVDDPQAAAAAAAAAAAVADAERQRLAAAAADAERQRVPAEAADPAAAADAPAEAEQQPVAAEAAEQRERAEESPPNHTETADADTEQTQQARKHRRVYELPNLSAAAPGHEESSVVYGQRWTAGEKPRAVPLPAVKCIRPPALVSCPEDDLHELPEGTKAFRPPAMTTQRQLTAMRYARRNSYLDRNGSTRRPPTRRPTARRLLTRSFPSQIPSLAASWTMRWMTSWCR